MLETFPVFDEYRAFGRHDRVNSYAMERFGYVLDVEDMARLSSKYRLPPGVMPRLRHSVDYWSRRRRAGQAIRALIGR